MTVLQPTAHPARAIARARLAAAPPALLGLLALALTMAYYGAAYHTQVLAGDRIPGLFVGFQSIEGQAEPYRWTKGEGTVCLPAAGATRPRALLQLRLLGSSVTAGIADTAIDRAGLRLGDLALPLQIAPESRIYRLLIPPGQAGGPICLTIQSDTVDPQGNGRVVGVGLRSVDLWKLGGAAAPPYGQLAVNLWLALGGYWLLRRLALPRLPAAALVLGLMLALGAGLVGGAMRVAPNLPYWSAFAAGATGLILAALLAYQAGAPALRPWQREALGAALIAAVLGAGWYALLTLPGYIWPFPMMARGGVAFGWAVVLPIALGAALVALVLAWLRRDAPPPSALALAALWLAAAGMPLAIKAALRGWESVFQAFATLDDDYIDDVPLVGHDPIGFLRGYVERMPDLALHNKTHPPGNTLFLWAIERALGPGPAPATWTVIALSALGVVPTYLLARRLLGWRAGVLAAAIYATLPAYSIYAVTSMDALLAAVLACAIYAMYVALLPAGGLGGAAEKESSGHSGEARAYVAALAAGLLIGLGLLLSFTTLMLALVAAALAVWRLRAGPVGRAELRRWAGVGAVVAGGALLVLGAVWLASGYSSAAALLEGMANNKADVGRRVSPIGLASYLFFLAVNVVAFGWFLGPWPLYRLIGGAREAIGRAALGRARPADALGAGLVALVGGMLASGLFYREVERVWLFSHILIAAALADGIMQGHDHRRRAALGALMVGALLVHSIIFRAILRVSW